ncbi:MAG: proline--tRNA ligase [Candidatus Margulisiibacteriota bacterium]|nr:MAG: proline--tRNA ligase [Candidatus Margulisbacteria bacterium GWF2_38_17]OGI09018.1 MAG: proline--tRNA ligase [Candidatus Margulisbacteria bacterium GWE2_39_32]PZM84985.1 MAG: proline--tRNA ligase [Candidatus Margulisiibacteriota bacterium]HCY37857.1 proline--tRNA ligase [Candidatus Margulisiibacteriota bacterium]
MKMSELFMPTLREDPVEAEVLSHKYMLRGGFIRKLAAGIYSLLPLGNRVIKKLENIVREEMNNAGAQEIVMPSVIPAELWKESGRWDKYGKELLRINDRHGREFCFGPTHEEVVTNLVKGEVRSYKELPLNLYQIQTKFRDEVRPRFGLMRGREFVMKDAYSFHESPEDLDTTYKKMYEAYCKIFNRCGLQYKVVEADTGLIGGNESHEFIVLAETGETDILYCNECDYATNIDIGKAYNPVSVSTAPRESKLRKVPTPNVKSIDEVRFYFMVNADKVIKSIIYMADKKPIMVLVRGDHRINEDKLKKLFGYTEVILADEEVVLKVTGAKVGFSGPIGLKEKIKIIADEAVMQMNKAIIGANEIDTHYRGALVGEDIVPDVVADIRFIEEGDICLKCNKGKYVKTKGIEVGHIFKLGTKYSEAMNATFSDKNGKDRPFIMGCYGIGIGRTAAAAIEQNHDDAGIKWPSAIAPFEVDIIIVNIKDEEQKRIAQNIYNELKGQNIDTILDDRDERAGVKFKDAELAGFPINVIVGKSITQGTVEVQFRRDAKKENIAIDEIAPLLKELF